MFWVYSSWYIVLAILIVAVIALIIAFFKMDKKDRILIQEFIAKNSEEQSNAVEIKPESDETKENEKVEKKSKKQ